jgi:hypothetical protein
MWRLGRAALCSDNVNVAYMLDKIWNFSNTAKTHHYFDSKVKVCMSKITQIYEQMRLLNFFSYQIEVSNSLNFLSKDPYFTQEIE